MTASLGVEQRTASAANRRRQRWKALMRMGRRGHLYTGLFMIPWVLLYAISGILFNHPSLFAKEDPAKLGSMELRGTSLEKLPQATTLGEQLVRSLQADAEIRITRMLDLRFTMAADGRSWRVTYSFEKGSVAALALDEGRQPVHVPTFLKRLHLARTYPDQMNVRWLWAVLVDTMGIVMAFWVVSGLFMWWQIRAVRWTGLGVLVLSALVVLVLTLGMHGALVS